MNLHPADILAPDDFLATSGVAITAIVELDVTSGAARATTPTYTEVTDYTNDPATLRRGRTYELADMDSGQSSIVFENHDRRFDPLYTAGPYYPNLKPMRPFRVSAILDTITYRVFTGYALEFPPVWDGPGWSYTTVRAVDAMGPLALSTITGTWSQEKTGTRIGRVLDAIGFPAANRVIDTGRSDVAAATFVATDGKTALDHIRECERTENGLFFFDGQGRAIFKSRSAQLIASAIPKATFGDTGTDLGYEDAPGDYGDRLIYNTVTVTDSAATGTTRSDTASADSYWPRSYSRATLLPAGSTETSDAAYFLLANYKDPGFRFKRLTFIASLTPEQMLEALTREIGDRITVKKTPPGGGAPISQDCIVQSIAHEIHPSDELVWLTTYELAPASTTTYWIAGDAVAGLAGLTTRAGY